LTSPLTQGQGDVKRAGGKSLHHEEFAPLKVVIYNFKMDISVTTFKAHCLDLIRKVEERGETITIRRRGRIVARLEPATGAPSDGKPWERLRALGGSADIASKDSVWKEEDFEALR
jgi:antitoxin (DNA-binding transcriptional repressor) of toxin-antitoxin stability system